MRDPQLRQAAVGAAHDFFRRYSAFEFIQHRQALLVIHGSAIVGIDEAQVPQFAALVGIWHAGRGEFHKRLREAVDPARLENVAHHGFKIADEIARLENPFDEAAQRIFELLVLLGPACLLLGLAYRLLHVAEKAFARNGPRADESLIEKILGVAVGKVARLERCIHARPAIQRAFPASRNLRQCGQARANVFAALGVVGGERGHGARVRGLHMLAVVMEFFDRDAVAAGRTADFVEADHAVEAVERGIFDALGHHGRSELLEAEQEFALARAAHTQHEDVADEIEEPGVDVLASFLAASQGVLDFCAVFIGDLIAFRDCVGAVDGETGCDFAKGAADFRPRIVAPIAVVFANLDKQAGQPIHVAAQGFVLDGEFLFVRDCIEVRWLMTFAAGLVG